MKAQNSMIFPMEKIIQWSISSVHPDEKDEYIHFTEKMILIAILLNAHLGSDVLKEIQFTGKHFT